VESFYEPRADSINCDSISLIQGLTPLICIRKEPDSNLGGNRVFMWFSAVILFRSLDIMTRQELDHERYLARWDSSVIIGT
jgi:hypothetical protein